MVQGRVGSFSELSHFFDPMYYSKGRGAVVEWLEQLDYGAESRRIA